MNNSKKINFWILGNVVVMTLFSFADDIAVGKWERFTIDGETPAVGSDKGVFINNGSASVVFAGNDAWSLPMGNLFVSGSGEIGISSGTLRLIDSVTPDFVANPPNELNKAALWLDASKNVQTSVLETDACVTAWFDARETGMSDSGYGHAAVGDTTEDGPVASVENGIAFVSFRGYQSNSTKYSLLYRDIDGSKKTFQIRHAFFVQSVVSAGHTAPVLGNTSASNFYTYPTGAYSAMLAVNGAANPLAYACEYLFDGAYADPTVAIQKGRHLHEFTLPENRTISVDSLVRDRNLAAGGHRIHELLLFTCRLTVKERMRISEYLKRKWACGGKGAMTFYTASGASIEIPQSVDTASVVGEGTIIAASGAKVKTAHLYADKKDMAYSLKDNTSSIEIQAAEYEYNLSPRDSLLVTDSLVASVLTKDTVGENGTASVSSARRFQVARMDTSITNLLFSGGGDLILRAPSSSDSKYETGTVAAATFEMTSLSILSGNTAASETEVSIPASGDWELEFKMANSLQGVTSDAGTACYIVQLRREDGSVVWECTPTFVSTAAYGEVDQKRRYLLRDLLPGTYTFSVKGYSQTTLAGNLSDLAMSFVPNRRRERVVPVKDGDFESSRFLRAFFATRDNRSNGKTEWNLTNGDLKQNPAVQAIVSSSMGYSGNYDYMFASPQLKRYGDNSLLWYHNNSTATSPATTLRAGTYKLRLDAVRWMTGTAENSYIDKNTEAGNRRCNNPATFSAMASINNGASVPLGTIGPISSFTAQSFTFPENLNVSEGDSVKIILEQTAGWAAAQIDNLEFVMVDNNDDDTVFGAELITDGSFSDSSAWNRDDRTDGFRRIAEIRSPTEPAFGNTICDGNTVMRSAQGGRAWQTVTLPAGVFKLSWWSRARVSSGNVSNRTRLSFWIAAEGMAVTNEIVRSDDSWCTNFINQVAYFKVPESGKYVIGFNSEEKSGTDVLVDCLSVRQVLREGLVPDIPNHSQITVSGGGKMRLDYNGCLSLSKVRIGGKTFSGEISADKYPDYFCGPGMLFVSPAGLVVTLR